MSATGNWLRDNLPGAPYEMSEGLCTAIIRRPRVGAEDHYGFALMFDAEVSPGQGALQVVSGSDPRFGEILRRVDDARQLEGKPCWVNVSEKGLILFERMWEP